MKAVIFTAILFLLGSSSSGGALQIPTETKTLESCAFRQSCDQNEATRICFCDEVCRVYRDCCYNDKLAASSEKSSVFEDEPIAECVKQSSGVGVNMIVACQEDWEHQDRYIEENCEGDVQGDWSDPLLKIPLSNNKTGATYKNYYCAICNQDQVNSIMWEVYLQNGNAQEAAIIMSQFQATTLWKNLNFSRSRQEWGLWVSFNSTPSFYPLKINPKMPKSLSFRRCMPDVVSSCPPNWIDREILRKCTAYLSPVYSGQIVFKNAHCAFCNGADANATACYEEKEFFDQAIESEDINPDVFSLLLDMNPLNYDDRDEIICSPEDIWDPFLKKCRSIACGSQYFRMEEDGSCHPILSSTFPISEYSEYIFRCFDCPMLSANFELYANGSLLILSTGSIIDQASYFIRDDATRSCMNELRLEHDLLNSEYFAQFQTCMENYHRLNNGSTSHLEYENLPLNAYILLRERLFICNVSFEFRECDQYVDYDDGVDPMYPSEFLSCKKIHIPKKDVEIQDDRGTIYVPAYQRHYNTSEYLLDEESQTVQVCHVYETPKAEKIDDYEEYITRTGIGISIIFLLLHLLAFCFLSEMRNLPGLNLASLCLALLLAYSSFLFMLYRSESKASCTAIALFIYYFFLASFFWMNAISFDVWRSLYLATSSLQFSGSGNKIRRFTLNSLYAWLCPLALLTVSLLVEYLPGIGDDYRPQYGQPMCWINNRFALAYLFGLPMVILLAFNAAFFVWSSVLIITNTVGSAAGGSSSASRINYKLYIRLAIMMGLTWITGIVSAATDSTAIFLIFIVFNTLKGLLIFVSFTCSYSGVKKFAKKIFANPFKDWDSSKTDQSHTNSISLTTRR